MQKSSAPQKHSVSRLPLKSHVTWRQGASCFLSWPLLNLGMWLFTANFSSFVWLISQNHQRGETSVLLEGIATETIEALLYKRLLKATFWSRSERSGCPSNGGRDINLCFIEVFVSFIQNTALYSNIICQVMEIWIGHKLIYGLFIK